MLRGRWQLGGMAAGGVVATHLLTFAAAAPDPHQRAELLARTGHVSTTLLAAAALGLAVAAAVRFLPLRRPTLQLVAIQTLGWLALESVERLSHDHAHWEVGLIAIGVVVQAAIAVVGALLLKAVRRVLAHVARRRRTPRHAAAGLPRPRVSGAVLKPAVLAGAAGLRGPPYGF